MELHQVSIKMVKSSFELEGSIIMIGHMSGKKGIVIRMFIR
ncbi:hypothetical protein SAMN05444274_10213 [Mariniphaga anaerophila]|uniref:Uncharacterized protein n=1 Tax=Mariniphaga anaerophila TaxID=1484053 RepID=A0A1M4V7X5_9BACT|nr:hypothetical protein SAMN05444274_10213 [Mariniphaga anaerophila]